MFGRKKRKQAQSDSVQRDVSKEPTDGLHPDAKKELTANLMPGEEVELVIHGLWDQAMIVTNQHRILVFKKGMMGGVMFGHNMISWDFSGIHGVQMEMGPAAGFIAFQTTNAPVQNMSYWDSGRNGPGEASHAIPLNKDIESQAREGVVKLRQMLHEYRHPKPATDISPSPRDASRGTGSVGGDRFCFACGAELRPGAAFCGSCGQKLT